MAVVTLFVAFIVFKQLGWNVSGDVPWYILMFAVWHDLKT